MWPKGKPRSQETKDKMSKTTTGRKCKPMSDEQRAKLSAINTGKKLSQETREKISKSLEGNKHSLGFKHAEETRKRWSEQRRGKKHKSHICSEETKRKTSATLMGRKFTDEHKAKLSMAAKGHAPTFVGERSEEYRRHLSESLRGKPKSEAHKLKLRGIPKSAETRRKISEAKTGHKLSPEHIAKMSKRMMGNKYTLGHKASDCTKKKLSVRFKGENNPAWRGGVSGDRYRLHNFVWKQLRAAARKRDLYTCQLCLTKECRLDVHHKLPHRLGGEDNLDNLVSLCQSCHSKIENMFQRVVEPYMGVLNSYKHYTRTTQETESC